MSKRFSVNSIYNYLVIILLLIAAAIRGGAAFEWLKPTDKPLYSLVDVQKAFHEASSFEINSDRSLSVLNQDKVLLGYALVSDDLDANYQGYAGEVPLLIAMDSKRTIIATHLLKNNETKEFLDHVNDTHLLDKWNAMMVDTSLLSLDIDAVTGATKSSKAIIRTFQYTVGNYLEADQQHTNIRVMRVVQLTLMALLLFLSLSMTFSKRFKKYYSYYLLLVFLVMGLWLKKMLSIELLNNWLTKGLPWQSNWELISILLLAICMAVVGRKKYYCNYMCPMGALQMIVSKASPFKKRNFSFKISGVSLRMIYLTFIWTSLLLGFTLPIAHLEPFMTFSFKVASWTMLGAGALIIIMSLFFNRPWCQLCPTGCLLDSVPSIKNNRKIKHHAK